jgi:outer membrane protein insertion porin family
MSGFHPAVSAMPPPPRRFSMLILLSMAFLAFQVSHGGEGPAPRIRSIEVKGNQKVETSTIQFYIRNRVGDEFSVARIREDILRIYRLGFFKDVQVDVEEFEGGLRVTFIVVEEPFVRDITIAGAQAIKREEIEGKLALKANSVLNRNQVRDSLDKIKQLYQEKGYYFADAEAVYTDVSPDEIDLSIRITEGEKILIKRITFVGNRAIEPWELKNVMETKESSLISFITGTGVYQREMLRNDLRRLEAFYQTRGFLRVEISEPDVRVDPKANGIFITIAVKEQEQYRVGRVRVEGDDLFSAAELKNLMKLQEGEIFDRSQLANDVLKLSDRYTERGYAFADVVPVTNIDQQRHLVNVDVQIDRGPQVRVGRVLIVGNEITRDKVIRREIRLNEGDLFDSSKLRRSRQRLGNLGFFEEVKLDTRRRPEEDLVDLEVRVKEQPTGAFTAGAGYSSTQSVIGTASIRQNNLFGRGQRLALVAAVSAVSADFTLSFTEPYFLDTQFSLGLEAFNRNFDYDSFESRETGAGLRFSRAIGEYLRVGLGYRYEDIDISDVAEDASQRIKDLAGRSTSSIITPSIAWDTRDNALNPSRGFNNFMTLDVAGGPLGAENQFYKVIGEVNWYYPLVSDLVFSARGRIGYADGYGGKELPLLERFFVGTQAVTIRGYRLEDVGPKDVNGDAIGGNSLILLSGQLRFPITQGLSLVGFIDAGNLYDKNEFDPTTLRVGIGAGIRFVTPLGPLALDWGFKLDRKAGEKPSEIHFNIGSLF